MGERKKCKKNFLEEILPPQKEGEAGKNVLETGSVKVDGIQGRIPLDIAERKIETNICPTSSPHISLEEEKVKKSILKEGVMTWDMPFLTLSSEKRFHCNEIGDILEGRFKGLASLLSSEDVDKAINRLLIDMIRDAFRDRFLAYSFFALKDSTEEIAKVQHLRIDQDKHLIYLLKTYIEFNRPPIKVSIKSAENVNIAGIDKQLNLNVTNKETL